MPRQNSDPRRSYPGQDYVDMVFDRVAKNYDLMNDLASFGLHHSWKRLLGDALSPPSSSESYRLLDLACGSGDIALICLRRMAALDLVLADRNPEMLHEARCRFAEAGYGLPRSVCCDAASLPLEAHRFDACTISFGIRNVADIPGTLAEMHRVLEPPGRFLCLEFTPDIPPGFGPMIRFHRKCLIPFLGEKFAGNAEAYQYLDESIEAFPEPGAFLDLLRDAGFENLTHHRLCGGIVGLFSAWVY